MKFVLVSMILMKLTTHLKRIKKMIEDEQIYGVWVGLEQVGYCLNKEEADFLAGYIESGDVTTRWERLNALGIEKCMRNELGKRSYIIECNLTDEEATEDVTVEIDLHFYKGLKK